MAPNLERNSSPMNVPHISDNDEKMLADEKGSHIDTPAPSLPTASDLASRETEITYPEGGRGAWFVVLGACCGLAASIGVYNTAGVFEVVISREILTEESPSSIGWIFSIYAFVTWVCGVQVGPTFDAMGPRALMIAGSACTLIGIFSLSFCTGTFKSHTKLQEHPLP